MAEPPFSSDPFGSGDVAWDDDPQPRVAYRTWSIGELDSARDENRRLRSGIQAAIDALQSLLDAAPPAE